MSNQIETYYYPNNINSAEFENRKVVFLALTGKDILESRSDIYEKYKNGEDVKGKVDGMVTLPLNAAINDSQSHDWAESDYLSAVKSALGAVSETVQGSSDDSMFGKWKGAFKWGDKAAKLLGSLGAGASAYAELFGVRKPMMNPGQFQNYTKSSLRSFSFDFVFIPENIKERDQVIEIVKFFKRNASPSLPGKLAPNGAEISTTEAILSKFSEAMMLSPHTWEIFVCNPHINKLMSFHECVCKNVSVTYGDSEKVAMFEDGMPKQISLKLDFAETSLQFSDSYGDTTIYEDMDKNGTGIVETVGNRIDNASGPGGIIHKIADSAAKYAVTTQQLLSSGSIEDKIKGAAGVAGAMVPGGSWLVSKFIY